jgi:hypothetical protein
MRGCISKILLIHRTNLKETRYIFQCVECSEEIPTEADEPCTNHNIPVGVFVSGDTCTCMVSYTLSRQHLITNIY